MSEEYGCVARLTARQRQIMALVLAGHPSKNIAADTRDQPTHRREPSFRNHEENGVEVAARAGPIGARRRLISTSNLSPIHWPAWRFAPLG